MEEYYKSESGRLYFGDSKEVLSQLPKAFAHTCITSPPYWALRDYHTASWIGGNPECDHVKDPTATKVMGNPEFNVGRPSREATKLPGYYYEKTCEKCGAIKEDLQLGQEPTFGEYIERLVSYFDLVWDALVPEGTLWVNLGDTYYGGLKGSGGKSKKQLSNAGSFHNFGRTESDIENARGFKESKELPDKSLCQIPARFAIAMQDKGWILRNDVIWHKPNKFPESVKDRFTHDYEHFFMFSKPNDTKLWGNAKTLEIVYEEPNRFGEEGLDYRVMDNGKKRSYWTSRDYYFVQQLEPVTESTKERYKRPWNGKVDVGVAWSSNSTYLGSKQAQEQAERGRNKRAVWSINTESKRGSNHFASYPQELVRTPILACCPEGGVVLDIFFGTGTTGVVAQSLNRKWVGIDLNKEYCEEAVRRLNESTSSL